MSRIARLAALTLALAACSAPRIGAAHPARSGPYTLELIDESGRTLPTFHHRGRVYVLGARGQRYLLRVRNETAGRIEVVASVDGRDVVDGKPASSSKPGYLVGPHGEVVIDGFRLSTESVAAFRFSAVERSYAAQMGDARDVGVVGVAVFTERPQPIAEPYPYPSREPSWNDEAEGAASRRGGADRSASTAPPPSSPSEGAPARGAGLAEKSRSADRPGLGTRFGEEHGSRVVEVAFERAASTPSAIVTLRYDDRPGLVALGVDVDGGRAASRDRTLRESAQPFRQDGFSEPPPGWSGR